MDTHTKYEYVRDKKSAIEASLFFKSLDASDLRDHRALLKEFIGRMTRAENYGRNKIDTSKALSEINSIDWQAFRTDLHATGSPGVAEILRIGSTNAEAFIKDLMSTIQLDLKKLNQIERYSRYLDEVRPFLDDETEYEPAPSEEIDWSAVGRDQSLENALLETIFPGLSEPILLSPAEKWRTPAEPEKRPSPHNGFITIPATEFERSSNKEQTPEFELQKVWLHEDDEAEPETDKANSPRSLQAINAEVGYTKTLRRIEQKDLQYQEIYKHNSRRGVTNATFANAGIAVFIGSAFVADTIHIGFAREVFLLAFIGLGAAGIIPYWRQRRFGRMFDETRSGIRELKRAPTEHRSAVAAEQALRLDEAEQLQLLRKDFWRNCFLSLSVSMIVLIVACMLLLGPDCFRKKDDALKSLTNCTTPFEGAMGIVQYVSAVIRSGLQIF